MKRRYFRPFLNRLEDRCVPAVRTWTGLGANDLWSNAANWDIGAPVSGDDVVIPDTAGSNEVIFDNSVAGGGVSLNSLGSDEPFRIATATLTLGGPGLFSFNGALTLSSGGLAGDGAVNVIGPTTWSGGAMSGAGVTNANGGLTLTGNLNLLGGRTLNNAGAATYSGAGNNFLSNSSSTFNNLATGTFTVDGNNDLTGAGTNPSFNNLGWFVKRAGASGDGVTTVTAAFNNSGTVDLQGGTLSLEGSDTSTGDFQTQAGTTLRFDGGTHTFNAGADVTAAGLVVHAGASFSATNTTIFNAGSSYTVTGTTQIVSGGHVFNTTANTAALVMTGGGLNGSGTFTVSGPTIWSGSPGLPSSMSGTGVTNANGGLTMTGRPALNSGRTLNNAGAATFNGVADDFLSIGSNSTFNNLATGTFTIDGNTDVTGGGPAPTFNNLGRFVKRAGATGDGVTKVTIAFNNSGLVDLQTGTLSLEGSGTSTGDFNTLAGTTLQFAGAGPHNFNAGADLTAAGLVIHAGSGLTTTNFNAGSSYTVTGSTQVTGGTHNFNITASTATLVISGGAVNFNSTASTPTLVMSGGSLGGTGTFTVSGLATWSGGNMSGGGVTNANGGLTMTGNPSLLARTLNNAAAATYNGIAGNTFTISNSIFNNLAGSTFTVDGNNDFHAAGFPSDFNNLGTFIKRGGATGDGVTTFNAGFNNSGLLDLQTGTLSLEGSDTSTGDFQTQAGTTLQFAGGGTHNFNAGADVTSAGLVVHAGSSFTTTNFNPGSTYTVTGVSQIVSGVHSFNIAANTSTLVMTGGGLAGSGTFTVSGPTIWSGGPGLPPAMSGTGVTNANGGLAMTGNLNLSSGRTLNNAAAATYNGGAGNTFTISSSTFNNLAGGTFTVDGNNDFHGGGFPTAFNNLGTFIKRAGATGDGITSFSAPLNNSGVVDLQSGTLSLDAGGTNAGAETIASAGLLAATSYTQSAGNTILAGGRLSATSGVSINGGSLTGSGTINANVANSGGQVSPSGTFSITGNYEQGTGGAINIDIAGTSPGTQFDQFNVVGGVGVSGTGLRGALNLNLVGGFVPSVGDAFVIVNNDGTDAVVGTFAGLPEGAAFMINGKLFGISYAGGTGNDIVLTALIPPNTPPSNVALNLNPSVDENGTATLNGTFTDPDATDTHMAVIDWGPGEGTTTLNLAAGVTSFTTSHSYLDDNPTGTSSDLYAISATVTEPASNSASGSTSVTVNNVAPTINGLSATPEPVTENGTVTLSGTIVDPGTQDTHTVVINWGPGEGSTTLDLAVGVLTFTADHQYLDDSPTGTAADSYLVSVTVTDDDGGSGSAGTNLTVSNSAPVLTSLSTSATTIAEGGSVTVDGAFTDAGTQDSFIVTINWGPGEGTSSATISPGAAKVFSFAHTYLDDNPTGTSSDNYPITVTITDDDTGTATGTNTVTVNNVAPTAVNDSAASNEDQAVTIAPLANDSDPAGALDPLQIISVTNGSKGTTAINTKGTADTTDDEIVYTPNPGATGSDSFTYTISDDDGGSTTATVSVLIRNLVDVSGRVFDDKDNDGAYELGEGDVGIGGVAVQLFDETSGTLVAAQTTATDGTYFFDVNLAAGTYKIVAAQPVGLLDGRETAGAIGGTVDNAHDSNQITGISVGLPGTTTDAIDYLFARIHSSQAQGLVWSDSNNDGEVNFGEKVIPGVALELTGVDDRGQSVSRSVTTDSNGVYAFLDLRPSSSAGYTIRETQPTGYVDGLDVLGTVNGVAVGGNPANDTLSGVVVPRPNSLAENYNFGERPPAGGGVQPGQTATIGFWQNKNGQNLIKSLNGGPTSTQLGNWLAARFPNMYGAGAATSNLTGMTNTQVAAYYKTLFARTSQTAPAGPPKVDAQIMATAFAVYVTNQTLAGTTATAYGFQVTADGVGARTFNVGSNGAAFGVANDSSVSVMDLLLAVNSRAHNGLLFDLNGDGQISSSEAAQRTMANVVFTGINEAGDI